MPTLKEICDQLREKQREYVASFESGQIDFWLLDTANKIEKFLESLGF